MQTEFTQFSNWITCQYPHSSARKHYLSDLALFFSRAEKPPSDISPHDVDGYIQHSLSKGLSSLTINRRLSSLRLIYYFLAAVDLLFPRGHQPRASQGSENSSIRLGFGEKANWDQIFD
jgi:site-specific recombinase XerD